MPAYRLEYAKTARAGCQAPECKKAKVKIEKGALKQGVWVEPNNETHAFFSYRHWGCVTPAQIKNMRSVVYDEFNGDFEILDGFEELERVDQDRIRKALEEGHIADEDCVSVDPAMNRPGAAEAAKAAEKAAKREAKEKEKAEKKAAKDAEKAEMKANKEKEKVEKKEAAKATKEAAKVANQKSKRKREDEDESDEEADDFAASKKSRRVKEDSASTRPQRGQKKPAMKGESEISTESESDEVVKPAKRSAAKRTTNTKLKDAGKADEVDPSNDKLASKSARTKKPEVKAKQTEKAQDSELEEENQLSEEPKPAKATKPKGGRPKKAQHEASEMAGEAPARKSSRKKAA